MNLKKIKSAFYQQRSAAKIRGIPFLLTFNEWYSIWLDSGYFEQRGRNKHQYVMSRLNDKGAYQAGNVKIQLHSDNTKESWRLKKQEIAKRMSVAHTGKPKPWLKGLVRKQQSIKKQILTRKNTGYVPLRKIRILDNDSVRIIKASHESPYVLARRFKVHPGTIYQIRNGRTYKDVC